MQRTERRSKRGDNLVVQLAANIAVYRTQTALAPRSSIGKPYLCPRPRVDSYAARIWATLVTTAIYANAMGPEGRNIAAKMWV